MAVPPSSLNLSETCQSQLEAKKVIGRWNNYVWEKNQKTISPDYTKYRCTERGWRLCLTWRNGKTNWDTNNHMLVKIWKLIHCVSVDSRMTEINYKCLARWYATPDKLSSNRISQRTVGEDVRYQELWHTYGGIAPYWRNTGKVLYS